MFKIFRSNITNSSFFNTTIRYFGRRTGTNALDPKPRGPSKKQIKRKTAFVERNKLKIKPHVERIKNEAIQRQVESGAFDEKFNENMEDLESVLNSLVAPNSGAEFGFLEDENDTNELILLDPNQIKDVMKTLKSDIIKSLPDGSVQQQQYLNNNKYQDDTSNINHYKQAELYDNQVEKETIKANRRMRSHAVITSVTSEQANLALKSSLLVPVSRFSMDNRKNNRDKDRKKSKTFIDINLALNIYKSMHNLNMKIDRDCYHALMRHYTKDSQKPSFVLNRKKPDEIINNCYKATQVFQDMILNNVDADATTYELLIKANLGLGTKKGFQKANEILNEIPKYGLQPTLESYVPFLWHYVHLKQYEEVDNWWIDTKNACAERGLTLSSFQPMFAAYSRQGMIERSLFLLDEMRCYDIIPDNQTFVKIFRTCAEAPFHVKGYHDMLFEVMSLYEGYELIPNKHIYSAVIYACARAGDADAAELYFKEMLRKNIVPDDTIYANLLYAFSYHNAVGPDPLDYTGRYVEPPRILTEEEKQIILIGKERAAEISSRGISLEGGDTIHKGKRNKSQIVDLHDDADARNAIPQGNSEIFINEEIVAEAEEALHNNGGWRLNEVERMIKEAEDLRKKPRYVGFYRGPDGNQDFVNATKDNNRLLRDHNDHIQGLTDGNDTSSSTGTSISLRRGGDGPTKFFNVLENQSLNQDNENNSQDFDLNKELEDLDLGNLGLNMNQLQNILKANDGDIHSIIDSLSQDNDDDDDVDKMDSDMFHNLMVDNDNHDDMHFPHGFSLNPEDEYGNPIDITGTTATTKITTSSSFPSNSNDDELLSDMSSWASLLDGKPQPINPLPTKKNENILGHSNVLAETIEKDPSKILDLDYDQQWALVEFVRAADPDYDEPLERRWARNKERAEALVLQMQEQGIPLNVKIAGCLMGVYTEALDVDGSERIWNLMEESGLKPNASCYKHMIRMHIRMKNTKKAMQIFDDLHKKKLDYHLREGFKCTYTYGLILNTLTREGDLVRAVRVLEMAAEKNIKLSEVDLWSLRDKLNELDMIHPDMPKDPYEWFKHMQNVRKNFRRKGQKKGHVVQSILSAKF